MSDAFYNATDPHAWSRIRQILLRAPGDGWVRWEDLCNSMQEKRLVAAPFYAVACAHAEQAGLIESKSTGPGTLEHTEIWYRAVTGERACE